jgi:hypothetical protein
MLADHLLGHADQVLGLVAIKARRADQFFQLTWLDLGQFCGGRAAFEQCRRHEIDALVCALGRENRRDKQFVGAAVLERAIRNGVVFAQNLQDLLGTLAPALLALTGSLHRRACGGSLLRRLGFAGYCCLPGAGF